MRLSALNRLRFAFFGIGALLLGPLTLLAHSVNQRLEAQRRLRHEVVAERIFDELERELTTVLSQELARPSLAYDAASMEAPGGAAYVLGYFTTAGGDPRLLNGPNRDDERERRIRWAFDEWGRRAKAGSTAPPTNGTPAPPGSAAEPASPAVTGQFEAAPAVAPGRVNPAPASPRSSPEILKRLNRSKQERKDVGY
jgi:hypothetical protein